MRLRLIVPPCPCRGAFSNPAKLHGVSILLPSPGQTSANSSPLARPPSPSVPPVTCRGHRRHALTAARSPTAYARLPFRPDGLKVYWLANGTGRRRAIGSLSRGWVGWRLPSAYLANAMCARPYSRDKASWTLWFRGIDESEAFSNCKPVENSLPVAGHLAKRTPIPLAYTRQRGWARNTVWCW